MLNEEWITRIFFGSSTRLKNAVRLYESVSFRHASTRRFGGSPANRLLEGCMRPFNYFGLFFDSVWVGGADE